MFASPLATAHRLLIEAVEALAAVAGPGADDAELLSVLTICEGVARRLDGVSVRSLGALERRGSFADRGYKTAAGALADLLRQERFEARRRVVAAESVCERVGIDGATRPPRLPATAEAFTAGQASLRHVEVIAKLLDTPAARRLTPDQWAGVEAQLADKTDTYTASELQTWGTALIDLLDEDGPEPDDRPPAHVNELHLTRRGRGGGSIKGRFEDAAMFDAVATVLDAKSAPLTADDNRSAAERQAEALAEVCGFVLDRGDVRESGGRRPHLNVLIRLEDLENRARSAMLDFGGTLSPESLRMLACDAAVIPIVTNGKGQPLDVGRLTRTIPDGLRRAIIARACGGCEHPGCGRPASWCEIHHLEEWQNGGETALHNCVMVCKYHHRLLHRESGWTVRIRDGLPEFLPPAWIDLERRPRRKPLPHLVTAS